jgi:hypothetical protein
VPGDRTLDRCERVPIGRSAGSMVVASGIRPRVAFSDPAALGGPAQRAEGVVAEPQWAHPGSESDRFTAARRSGRPSSVPRVDRLSSQLWFYDFASSGGEACGGCAIDDVVVDGEGEIQDVSYLGLSVDDARLLADPAHDQLERH